MKPQMPSEKTATFLAAFKHSDVAQKYFEGQLVRNMGNLGLLPRVFFAGRSNVGKSSLLNALTKSRIARVSRDPGRTQEFNFFLFRKHLLVDLPGYGFAKVAKTLRAEWGEEIPKLIVTQQPLKVVVSLVDSRVGFTPQDEGLVEYLKAHEIPFLVVFTKIDKFKSANEKLNIKRGLTATAGKLGVHEILFCSVHDERSMAPLRVRLFHR